MTADHTPERLSVELTDAERVAVSTVVHQNYYMPDVFATFERLMKARAFLIWEAGFDGGVAASRGERVENPYARSAPAPAGDSGGERG